MIGSTSLRDLAAASGIPIDAPLALASVDAKGRVEECVSGTWPNRQPVTPRDRFYAASLAKQVTGAAAALLVRDGQLDPDAPIARYLGGLPGWARRITARQLAHHTAGLPEAGIAEAAVEGDWTEDAAMDYLARLNTLPGAPGSRYRYSNLGYILLARLVATVSGRDFAEVVADRLELPEGMGFTSQISDFPQGDSLGPALLLTFGDGGLWTTAGAFARWLDAQNKDRDGLSAMVTEGAILGDGTTVPYGWGLGLRTFRGRQLFIHGGEWPGAAAKAVRCPSLGIAVVALASGSPIEAVSALVDTVLSQLADDA
jgi:CubicO group peptidase (beta-lactamase class C family)